MDDWDMKDLETIAAVGDGILSMAEEYEEWISQHAYGTVEDFVGEMIAEGRYY